MENYYVEASLLVDFEFLEKALEKHEINLVKIFEDADIYFEKMTKMDRLRDLFKRDKEVFVSSLQSSEEKLKPFTKVNLSKLKFVSH